MGTVNTQWFHLLLPLFSRLSADMPPPPSSPSCPRHSSDSPPHPPIVSLLRCPLWNPGSIVFRFSKLFLIFFSPTGNRISEPKGTSLPFSRSGDVVEYLLKSQWFVRCREMGERAAKVRLQCGEGLGPGRE